MKGPADPRVLNDASARGFDSTGAKMIRVPNCGLPAPNIPAGKMTAKFFVFGATPAQQAQFVRRCQIRGFAVWFQRDDWSVVISRPPAI